MPLQIRKLKAYKDEKVVKLGIWYKKFYSYLNFFFEN